MEVGHDHRQVNRSGSARDCFDWFCDTYQFRSVLGVSAFPGDLDFRTPFRYCDLEFMITSLFLPPPHLPVNAVIMSVI